MSRPVQLTLPGIPTEPTQQEIRALVAFRLHGLLERQGERDRRRAHLRQLAARARLKRSAAGSVPGRAVNQ